MKTFKNRLSFLTKDRASRRFGISNGTREWNVDAFVESDYNGPYSGCILDLCYLTYLERKGKNLNEDYYLHHYEDGENEEFHRSIEKFSLTEYDDEENVISHWVLEVLEVEKVKSTFQRMMISEEYKYKVKLLKEQ